jgi:hypothetical protein
MNSKLKQNRGRAPRNRSAGIHAPERVPDRARTRIGKITCRPPRGSGSGAKIAQKKGGRRCRGAGPVCSHGPSASRPCESRDPYSVSSRSAAEYGSRLFGRDDTEIVCTSVNEPPARKSGSSSGQADSWSRRSQVTLKRNLIQTVRSKLRGVSGPVHLSGQCYTVVTSCVSVSQV